MTFPTAEDIEIIDCDFNSIYENNQRTNYEYYLKISKYPFMTKEEVETLKQQILSEHEIVERLKKRIKYIERISPLSYMSERQVLVNVLKSILEGNE